MILFLRCAFSHRIMGFAALGNWWDNCGWEYSKHNTSYSAMPLLVKNNNNNKISNAPRSYIGSTRNLWKLQFYHACFKCKVQNECSTVLSHPITLSPQIIFVCPQVIAGDPKGFQGKGNRQRWFTIVCSFIATLNFFEGLPSKY